MAEERCLQCDKDSKLKFAAPPTFLLIALLLCLFLPALSVPFWYFVVKGSLVTSISYPYLFVIPIALSLLSYARGSVVLCTRDEENRLHLHKSGADKWLTSPCLIFNTESSKGRAVNRSKRDTSLRINLSIWGKCKILGDRACVWQVHKQRASLSFTNENGWGMIAPYLIKGSSRIALPTALDTEGLLIALQIINRYNSAQGALLEAIMPDDDGRETDTLPITNQSS